MKYSTCVKRRAVGKAGGYSETSQVGALSWDAPGMPELDLEGDGTPVARNKPSDATCQAGTTMFYIVPCTMGRRARTKG